jgi:hypothetical protein
MTSSPGVASVRLMRHGRGPSAILRSAQRAVRGEFGVRQREQMREWLGRQAAYAEGHGVLRGVGGGHGLAGGAEPPVFGTRFLVSFVIAGLDPAIHDVGPLNGFAALNASYELIFAELDRGRLWSG